MIIGGSVNGAGGLVNGAGGLVNGAGGMVDSSGPPTHHERLSNGRLRSEYYEPIPPDRFAPKPGDEILNIGIVGAGIAGLTAASALLQSGHRVEIFERSRFANEIGAAINMCPNATRVLSYLEFNFDRARPVTLDEQRLTDGRTLDLRRRQLTPDFQLLFGAPFLLYHRADLHNELRRTATEPRPHTFNVAKINLSANVVDVSLDGKITLCDGKEHTKDVVIVADGISTRFASKVIASDEDLWIWPTGSMAYRFLVPSEKLMEDAQTRHLFEGKAMKMVVSPAGDQRLVWYPCRGGELQNFGFFLPDDIEGFEEEVWSIPASREKFMRSCTGLHPDLQAVCGKAEDLKLWRLCSRKKPLSKLARGQVVLVGDAAHPMLPHQGQGGAMAIEDAAALGVLLSGLKSKDAIPQRLQLFEQLRLRRVSAMVIFSSVGQDEAHRIKDMVKPFVDGPLPTCSEDYHEYNFTPNILRDAMELLESHQGSARL